MGRGGEVWGGEVRCGEVRGGEVRCGEGRCGEGRGGEVRGYINDDLRWPFKCLQMGWAPYTVHMM